MLKIETKYGRHILYHVIHYIKLYKYKYYLWDNICSIEFINYYLKVFSLINLVYYDILKKNIKLETTVTKN